MNKASEFISLRKFCEFEFLNGNWATVNKEGVAFTMIGNHIMTETEALEFADWIQAIYFDAEKSLDQAIQKLEY